MSKSADSQKSGPYSEAVTTRLTPRNYERYEDYAEREELSKSEALRQLVRTGLDHAEPDEDDKADEDSNQSLADVLLALGVVLGIGVAAGLTSAGGNPDQSLVYMTAALIGGGLLLRFTNHE